MKQMVADWRQLPLSDQNQALCNFAEKLTESPAMMSKMDVAELKATGLDETAIHDAVQIISYFNYINRVADALGVDMDDHVAAWEQP